jgi:hypothetical protein
MDHQATPAAQQCFPYLTDVPPKPEDVLVENLLPPSVLEDVRLQQKKK